MYPRTGESIEGVWNLRPYKALNQNGCLSDIWDGELYREFVASTAEVGHRISFTLNADGTPLFWSSGTAIWPIQLQFLLQRGERSWFSCPLVWQEKTWHGTLSRGICGLHEWLVRKHEGVQKNFKPFCICCAVDSVVRAPMQGTKQFNSYQGCNWCFQGKRFSKSMKYLAQLEEPIERTDKQMVADMEASVRTNKPVNDVATASPLVNLE